MSLVYSHLPTAFPWYDRKEKQQRFRSNCVDVTEKALIAPLNGLLPFQFRKAATSQFPISLKIYDLNDVMILDISDELDNVGHGSKEGYDYFYYRELTASVGGDEIDLQPCTYYVVMEFESGSMYSEVFKVPQNSFRADHPEECDFLILEWTNEKDMRPMLYNVSEDPIINRVYLDTTVTSSEPSIEVETETDDDNVQVPLFQRAVIPWRISVVVPDYLKIALMLMQMHDSISLSYDKGLWSGEIKNIAVSATVESPGCMSTVEILFQQDLLIAKAGCGDDMDDTYCPAFPDPYFIQVYPTPYGYHYIGTIPENTYATFYGEDEGGSTYATVIADHITPSQLDSGFNTVGVPGFSKFKVILRTFACVVGDRIADMQDYTPTSRTITAMNEYDTQGVPLTKRQIAALDRFFRNMQGETDPSYDTFDLTARVYAFYPYLGGSPDVSVINAWNPSLYTLSGDAYNYPPEGAEYRGGGMVNTYDTATGLNLSTIGASMGDLAWAISFYQDFPVAFDDPAFGVWDTSTNDALIASIGDTSIKQTIGKTDLVNGDDWVHEWNLLGINKHRTFVGSAFGSISSPLGKEFKLMYSDTVYNEINVPFVASTAPNLNMRIGTSNNSNISVNPISKYVSAFMVMQSLSLDEMKMVWRGLQAMNSTLGR